MKETSHKRLHIVWFYLYEMSRIDKPIEIKDDLVVARANGEEWMGSDY